MIHELKAWPEFFDAIRAGRKTFEVRLDDRGFAEGHLLRLYRYQPDPEAENGGHYFDRASGALRSERLRNLDSESLARLTCRVSYVLRGGYALRPGYCVLALELDKKPTSG